MITAMKKSKAEKSPWVKKTKKTAQRRKKKLHFVKPLTCSATAEDPECLKFLLVWVMPLPLPLASLPIIM